MRNMCFNMSSLLRAVDKAIATIPMKPGLVWRISMTVTLSNDVAFIRQLDEKNLQF